MNKKKLFELCLKTWGEEAQCMMAIEEAGELIQALVHHYRSRIPLFKLRAEIADMTLMCEQLALIFGEREVKDIINLKLLRLERRVEHEGGKKC